MAQRFEVEHTRNRECRLDQGKRRNSLVGTLSAGPVADACDGPEWKAFVADCKATHPVSAGGLPSPSLFAYVCCQNMKAALDGLAAASSGRRSSATRSARWRRVMRGSNRVRPSALSC